MTHKILFLPFAFIALLLLTACDHPTTKEAMNQIQGGIDQAKEQIAPVADNVTSLTTEQINKLIRYEYRVITIQPNTSPQTMEGILASAGEERWECFSVVPSQTGLTVFCKRLPYALLRSLLRFM